MRVTKEEELVFLTNYTTLDKARFFAMGFDQIPFLAVKVEALQIVIGHELTVTTHDEDLFVVFKEISPKIAAVKNGFVEANHRIPCNLK